MNKVRLGDTCEILNGYAFKSENYVTEGIRVIRIANVQKGYIEDKEPQYYPINCEEDIAKYSLFENDLLISLTGNVGRVALLPKEMLPAALNQRVACLRMNTKSDISKDFLFHYLNSDKFENDCITSSKGVAQKNMSTEWLKKYEIPVFSQEKQRHISTRLSLINSLIEKEKLQLQKLDELIKSRFVEMFGDPVSNPLNWDTKPLLSLGNCKNGMNFHYDENGVEINCLGVGDFKDLSIIANTTILPTIILNEMPSKEYLLQNDDIVFVRSNGNKALVGRSVAVYPNKVPTTFSGFCIRFRKHDDTVIVPYLLRVLKTDSIRNKMAGRGANIQNLNQQILSTLEIPIPPLTLQNQFADFVAKVEQQKATVQKSIDKLETLKKSLMQEYFGA